MNDAEAAATAAILRARASAIAQRPAGAPGGLPAADEASIEVLEFRLAAERYAVETRFVDGVHPLGNLTPLPCTPAFLQGIVNLRGQVVAVLSLKRFFGLPEQGLTDLHRIVLLAGAEMGLLADMTVAVSRIGLADLQPPLPAAGGIGAQYVRGVTPAGIVVLDIERLLADPKLEIDDEPGGEPGWRRTT